MTAYVVEPGGPCNLYHWDADSGVPVLDGVLHPANARGVDLARVPLLPTLRRTPGETPRRHASWIEPLFEDLASELLAGLGPSLLALVVAQPPNPPGTRLAVRLLGAARVAPAAASATSYADEADALDDLSEWIAVAAPTADPTLTQVEHVSDLPGDLRQRLDHALADIAPLGSVSVQRPDAWLTADRVMAAYRAARARGRLAARAAEDAERGHARERLFSASSDEEGGAAFRRRLARNASAPAPEPISTWREIAPVSPAELRARGAAVYGEADQLIRWIPTRFARYLGELLLPDERVLFFAECPPLTLRGWSGRAEPLMDHAPESRRTATRRVSQAFEHLRTRHLQSGMLIITDRQALLLRDYAAPDATMVQWGYVARSWPLGRLVAVHALSPGIALDAKALVSWPLSVRDRLVEVTPFDEATVPSQYARLLVALEGTAGIQVTGVACPLEMRPALERAADLLSQFLPWLGAAGA
ncbi:MAG TPA: hypothetical protein VKT52_10505, partial [Ktedonobacterales bacterium]|nr:hypothetical protein [Ktedonobacterales bacterium]